MLALNLGSIPVRIHGSFFLTALLLGWTSRNPMKLAVWVGVVLVSVLVHELGHALTGFAFGKRPEIDLHGMGGTTSWRDGRPSTTLRSIAVSLAGPGAGFAFGLLVFFVARFVPFEEDSIVEYAFHTLLFVNIVWGILNLAPMLPLDGGNVLRATLNAMTRGNGERPARVVSIVLAGALGVWALVAVRDWWVLVLAGLFVYQNVQALRALSAVAPR